MLQNLPSARLCVIHTWPNFQGYGFVVDTTTDRGLFKIKTVEPDSPCEASGILVNDLILEVNGEHVDGMNYSDLVERIKSSQTEVSLLVIRPVERNCLEARGVTLKSNLCPTYKVTERFSPSQQTKEIGEKNKPSEAENTLLRADTLTTARLSRKRQLLLTGK